MVGDQVGFFWVYVGYELEVYVCCDVVEVWFVVEQLVVVDFCLVGELLFDEVGVCLLLIEYQWSCCFYCFDVEGVV